MVSLNVRRLSVSALFLAAALLAACDGSSSTGAGTTTGSTGTTTAMVTVGTLSAGSWLVIRTEDSTGKVLEMIEVNVGVAGAQCGVNLIPPSSQGTCANFLGNQISISSGGIGSQAATIEAPAIAGSSWSYQVHKK
jgi:hypothetical protein